MRIDSKMLAPNSVGTTQIQDGSVTSEKLASGLVGAYSKGYIYKCNLEWVSANQVNIKAGAARDVDDSITMVLSSDLTIDISTSGKNGLDTGSEAASSWYYVWLIKNTTTNEVAAIFSLSATSPTLPSGFTKKRLLGTVRNSSSSNLLKFIKYDLYNSRKTYWLEDRDTTLRVLNNGTSGTYVDLDLSTRVPPNSTLAILDQWCTGDDMHIRRNGDSMSFFRVTEKGAVVVCEVPTDSSQLVEYHVDGGGHAYVSVLGYEEEI